MPWRSTGGPSATGRSVARLRRGAAMDDEPPIVMLVRALAWMLAGVLVLLALLLANGGRL